MARLYIDEDFHRGVVQGLRAAGHDALTAFEDGKANQRIPDDQVLKHATGHDRILLTFNRTDFIRLHGRSSAHRGIIVCTVDQDIDALTDRILAALRAHPDMRGKLVRVIKPS